MRTLILGVLAALAAGCTAPITLQNRQGQTTTCGYYAMGSSGVYAEREAKCINDFNALGYYRMP